jgi:tripartite-type tricarboxylate transporter receptor subunit TctC
MSRSNRHRRMISAVVLGLACLLMLAGTAVDAAVEYPTKPVEMVVCYSPGGFTDMTARIICSVAGQYLGQPMVAVGKAGGSAAIGTQYTLQGGPTGYRLLWDVSTQCITGPLTIKGYPFSAKDLEIVAALTQTERTLVVRADAPWSTLEELFEYSLKNPGKVTYGSSGTGAWGHLSGEMLARAGKVKWVHIPYAGSSAALSALVGGHVDLVTAQPSEIIPLVEANKIKVLVATAELPSFPGVPTLEQLGYGPWHAEQLYCVAAPKGTPKPVLDKLEAVFEQVANDKSFINLMAKVGADVKFVSRTEASRRYAQWVEDLRPLVKDLGLLAN